MVEPRDDRGRFLPGNSGNGGRALGSRNKLTTEFVDAVYARFKREGPALIDKLDAQEYLRLCSRLIPGELSVALTPALPAGLDANDWAAVVGVARAVKERLDLRDLKPEDAAAHVSRALSAYDAKPIIDYST
jgi:hypothetical protein